MAVSDIIWRKILLKIQRRLGIEWNGMVGPDADFNCGKLCLYLNMIFVTNKNRREKNGRPNILNGGFWAPGLTQPMMAYSAATSSTEEKGPGLAERCAPNGGSTPDE